MTVALCTLVLNEMEWLPRLYEQHKDWPTLTKWIFVESADRVYAETNPELVTAGGLSTDGSTDFLQDLARTDDRIVHIRHGFSSHPDPAQGKCESRQQYLNALAGVDPHYLIVVDADEFYPVEFQSEIISLMNEAPRSQAFIFKHRDIWHPASIQDRPLFSYEVVGGFWDIPYCRCWRYRPGLQYRTNHNTPEHKGLGLDRWLVRYDSTEFSTSYPYFVHMGFACNPEIRKAKNRYYEQRGEAKDQRRSWYCDSRACFEHWYPGDSLPRSARVCFYDGLIPEAFIEFPI